MIFSFYRSRLPAARAIRSASNSLIYPSKHGNRFILRPFVISYTRTGTGIGIRRFSSLLQPSQQPTPSATSSVGPEIPSAEPQTNRKSRKFGVGKIIISAAAIATLSLSASQYLLTDSTEEYSLALFLTSIHRSLAIFRCGLLIMLDYKYSLYKLEREDEQYLPTLKEVHKRSAARMLALAQAHGGLLTKAAQHIASLRPAVPPQFSDALSVMQDSASPQPWESVRAIVESELGKPLESIFSEFDPNPIGVASLAQVHRARIRRSSMDGEVSKQFPSTEDFEVAVKVQHPNLHRLIESDLSTIAILFKLNEFYFPEFEFQWILNEFTTTIRNELKFLNEGKNAEKIHKNFIEWNKSNGNRIYIPKIYWNYSTNKILIMEFIRGIKVNDIYGLKLLGINPLEVAKIVLQATAEQTFIHGFLHIDMHAGNVLVRPRDFEPTNWESLTTPQLNWLVRLLSYLPFIGRLFSAPSVPQLVILDHGMTREISEFFRISYSGLWISLIKQDAEMVQYYANQMNIAQYSNILPILFTHRTITSKSRLGYRLPESESKKLKSDFKELKFAEIAEFLSKLPRDLLFAIRIFNLSRAINFDLGGQTSERFNIFAEACNRGFYIRKYELKYENIDEWNKIQLLDYELKQMGYLTSVSIISHSPGLYQRIIFYLRSTEIRLFLFIKDSIIIIRNYFNRDDPNNINELNQLHDMDNRARNVVLQNEENSKLKRMKLLEMKSTTTESNHL